MIWKSVYLMTGFDLVIMGTVAFAIWTLVKQPEVFRKIKFTGGFAVMCLGILSIGLLYSFDLGLMLFLPGFVPRAEAMAAMESLHLNYSWGFISVGTMLIVTGFAAVNRTTGSVIERLEVSRVELEKQLTARRQSEQALRDNEARFRDFAESASDWFWETDSAHRFTRFEGQATMVYDDPEAYGYGKTRFDVRMPNDDDDANWDTHRADLEGHRHFRDFVFPLEAADRTTHYVRVSGTPVFSDSGEFLGHRGVASDISEEVATKELARSAQQQLAAAIEGFPEAIVLFDADDRLVVANRAWREFNEAVAHVALPGISWKDYMRGLFDAGLFPEARGREEDWLEERLEKRREPSGPYEIARTGDSWIRVHDHRLPDGGILTVATDITTRKRAERRLTESEERFRDFAEVASDWFWETDVEHRFLYQPANAETATGYANDAVKGKTRFDIRLPDDQDDGNWARHREDLESRRTFRNFEYPSVDANRKHIWLRVGGKPRFGPNGDFLGYHGTASDITRRKRTEALLKESEERFRNYAVAASDWFWETDAEHRFTYLSEHDDPTTDALNRSGMGKTRFELRLGDDAGDETWDMHRADLAARRPFRNFEYPREGEKGAKRHMRVSGRPVFDDNGAFKGYRGASSDITDFVEAGEQARSARERLAAAIDGLSETFLLFDAEDRLVISNRTWRDIDRTIAGEIQPGTLFEDILRAQIQAGIIPEAFGQEEKWLRERLEQHRNPEGPFEIARPEDSWLLVNDHRLPDGGVITIATDISDLKRAEQRLRESETRAEQARARLVDAIESLHEGLTLVDSDDRFVMANKRFLELYGEVAHLYVPGKKFEDIQRGLAESGLVAEARGREDEWVRERIERHKSPGPPFERQLGPDLWMLASERKTSDGGTVSVVTDISELKKAEGALKHLNEELEQRVEERTAELRATQDELVKKERLATLGQLTATVSHELRNPLATIRNSLQVVRDAGPSDGQRVSRAVERAERNIIRCDRIIEELLDFTHTRDLEIRRIAIDRWLDQVLDEQAAPPGITVRRAFDLAALKVPVDAERLRRVVINVFDNACQAMAEGEVGQSDNGQPGHSLSVRTRRTGGRVEIVFEDTGPGIQPDARDRIFEPLFSTKGFGVGLGLTVVKQVMTQHGGDVEIESEPGRGTRVCLWLPWDKAADGEKT